jgi:hypothetical protein
MKGVDFPVLGIDNLGNTQLMHPGGEYEYQGDYVTELPMYGSGGLTQWFAEEWVDIKTGKKCGRSGKDKKGRPYPACRPSKRVNKTTPKTRGEMSAAEKAKFKRKKKSGKRIDYNHKRAQLGIEVPQRNGVRKNPDGSVSTHLMATETLDGKNWVSFPTLFQDPDGTWIDMSDRPWKEAYEEAKRRGELIEFGTDKEAAIKFGEGSWKLPKAQEGNGETISLSTSDPRYAEYYNRLNDDVVLADPSGKTAGRIFLDEVDVVADKATPPAFNFYGYNPTAVQDGIAQQTPFRFSPEGIAAEKSYQEYQDYINSLPYDQRPGFVPYEPPTISEYIPPSTAEWWWDKISNPMTSLGYVMRGQTDIMPDRVGNQERNTFDYAIDLVNPATYINTVGDMYENLSEGDIVGAGIDAISLAPIVPTAVKQGKNLFKKSVQVGNQYVTPLSYKRVYQFNPFANQRPPFTTVVRTQMPGQTGKLVMGQYYDDLANQGKKLNWRQNLDRNSSRRFGYGRGFSSDAADIMNYSHPSFTAFRGYDPSVIPPELLVKRLPTSYLDDFMVANLSPSAQKAYGSGKKFSEFVLPIDDVLSAETRAFSKEAYDEIRNIRNAELTPHWFKGFQEVKALGGSLPSYQTRGETPLTRDEIFNIPRTVRYENSNMVLQDKPIWDGFLDEVTITPYTQSQILWDERQMATGGLEPVYPIFDLMSSGLRVPLTKGAKAVQGALTSEKTLGTLAKSRYTPRFTKPALLKNYRSKFPNADLRGAGTGNYSNLGLNELGLGVDDFVDLTNYERSAISKINQSQPVDPVFNTFVQRYADFNTDDALANQLADFSRRNPRTKFEMNLGRDVTPSKRMQELFDDPELNIHNVFSEESLGPMSVKTKRGWNDNRFNDGSGHDWTGEWDKNLRSYGQQGFYAMNVPTGNPVRQALTHTNDKGELFDYIRERVPVADYMVNQRLMDPDAIRNMSRWRDNTEMGNKHNFLLGYTNRPSVIVSGNRGFAGLKDGNNIRKRIGRVDAPEWGKSVPSYNTKIVPLLKEEFNLSRPFEGTFIKSPSSIATYYNSMGEASRYVNDGPFGPMGIYSHLYYDPFFTTGKSQFAKGGSLPKAQKGANIYPVNAEGIPMGMLDEIVVKPSKFQTWWNKFRNLQKDNPIIEHFTNPLIAADNAIQILQIPSNLVRESIEGIGGKGDGEFNLGNIVPDIGGTTILDDTEAQVPISQVLGVKDPKGAAGVDILTDPLTYVGGAGIGKNIIQKAGTRVIPKIIKPITTVGKLDNLPQYIKNVPVGNSNLSMTHAMPGLVPEIKGTKDGVLIAHAAGPGNNHMTLKKFLDPTTGQDYYSFTESFIDNPMLAGRTFKMAEDLIPKGSILKQPPGGTLSQDSFNLMTRRLGDTRRFRDLTNYDDGYISLNEYAKGRIPLGNDRLTFTKNELNALNAQYRNVFNNLGISEFGGLGSRQVPVLNGGNWGTSYNPFQIRSIQSITDPRALEKYYHVSVPNITLQKLYQKGGEKTSWLDYANPFNWGVYTYDDAGTFGEAFAKARKEGQDQFMYYGDRYTTELAPTPEVKEEPKEDNSFYNKEILNGLSDKQLERRQSLLNAADSVAASQGNNEDLRKLLVMSAVMENTLGADSKAYGRDYTRSPMSIDDIAYGDIFNIREGATGYTAQQKKNAEWLNSLGINVSDVDSLLRSDDPMASMAVARLVYGRAPEALPSGDDPDALYNYYIKYYNKGGVDKYGGAEAHRKKFNDYYNQIYKKAGGENIPVYNTYKTKNRAWLAARKNLGANKKFMYGGKVYSTSTPKGL